jgi:hypothetical protein
MSEVNSDRALDRHGAPSTFTPIPVGVLVWDSPIAAFARSAC